MTHFTRPGLPGGFLFFCALDESGDARVLTGERRSGAARRAGSIACNAPAKPAPGFMPGDGRESKNIRRTAWFCKTDRSVTPEELPLPAAEEDRTLLLTEAWDVDLPYGALAYSTEAEMQADPRTIAEYAADNGYTRILEGFVGFDLVSDVMGVDEWKDNVVTVVYSLAADGDVLTLPIMLSAYDKVTGEFWQVTDKLTLSAAAPLWQVSSAETFDLPEYGVRIDGVRVTGTLLQSYGEVFYTVTDVEKVQNSGFRVDMLGAEGNALPRGMLGVGGSGLTQHAGDELIWHGGFGASADAPAQLTIRVRDFGSGAVTLPVNLN